MKTWFAKLTNFFPLLLVIVVAVFVSAASYKPGTYLSGWDTLHPEFNIGLYSQRVFFGAWQEHQGLGAPASQAHLAELPRLPLIWLLTTFLPQSAVRHVFFYIMYLLGGVGIYLYSWKIWFAGKNQARVHWAAAITALFYLLNLVTLQQFYVPLEMFAVHFATLGFVLLTLHNALKSGKSLDLLWLFIIQVSSSPTAHTATLFYMYLLLVGLYVIAVATFDSTNSFLAKMKRLMLIGVVTITAHLYWLIPNLYYILTHSNYVSEAKISRLFSDEAFWQNQAFGNISNVIILKNFLFNWKDFNFATGSFVDLFDEWSTHLVVGLGYVALYWLSMLSILGLVSTALQKKLATLQYLIPFSIGIFFLINLNPPTAQLFSWVLTLPLLGEALRFPFTKFSIAVVFFASLFLGQFAETGLRYLSQLPSKKQTRFLSVIFVGALLLLIGYGGKPFFSGNLVSSSMKINYPSYYQELFTWFDQQPLESRIAKFPATNFWGWNYYQWPENGTFQGYQGAGFTWFGLQQPSLDREFDRWVNTNEAFYFEIAEAIRTSNQPNFNAILKKYQVNWLMYDHSVIDPQNITTDTSYTQFQALVDNNDAIHFETKIGEIELYNVTTTSTGWITSSDALLVNGSSDDSRIDSIFETKGNYVSSPGGVITLPFANVLSERLHAQFSFKKSDTEFILGKEIPGNNWNTVIFPKWSNYQNTVPVKISLQNPTQNNFVFSGESILPALSLGGNIIETKDLTASTSTTLANLSLPTNSSYLLKLGDKIIPIAATNNPEQKISLATEELSLSSQTLLKIYSAVSLVKTNQLGTSTDCVTQQSLSESSTVLVLNQSSPCVLRSLPAVESDGLLEIKVDHATKGDFANLEICSTLDGIKCTDERSLVVSNESRTTSAVQIEVSNTETKKLMLKISDAKQRLSNRNNPTEINSFFESELLVDFSFRPQIQEAVIEPKSLEAITPQVKKITFNSLHESNSPTTNFRVYLPQFRFWEINVNNPSNLMNCSETGKVTASNTRNSYKYEVEGKAIGCENFFFPELSGKQEYLSAIKTRTTFGKPLKFYFKEFGDSATLLEEIPDNTSEYSLYSLPSARKNNGLVATIELPSYSERSGNISTSELQEFLMIPAPLEWLRHIEVKTESADTSFKKVQIEKINKYFNGLYLISVYSESDQGLLILNQSFDAAWVALDKSNGNNILDHYLYNSWANSWQIPHGSHSILILYWPQLLSFAGYGLLIITLLTLIIFSFKSKTKQGVHQPARRFKKLLSSINRQLAP